MKYWLVTIAICFTVSSSAQTISGRIYDGITQSALAGATLQVVGSEEGTSTNESGVFHIDGLSPGRYNIRVSFVGYESKIINNIWVKSGVDNYQEIGLSIQQQNLDEVIIFIEQTLSNSGVARISEEAINRYAATYNDPARLITSSPDIAVSNDQSNLVSVRGVSPNYNVWRLEGAEIVNPNHLSNAGTFLDRPTASGGGVNILSAQMLSASDFRYGTFSSQYGNSIGGIFNMNLKKGNPQERQNVVQASFIGFDLASFGPIQKGKAATYALNYRYSFTGLLSNFGVDFGGETIGFQDLSLSVFTPIGKTSRLQIFAIGGSSFNRFDHKVYEESEFNKDRSDIDYENKTGIVGLKYESLINNIGNLSTSVVLSGLENSRFQTNFDYNDESTQASAFLADQSILSSKITYSKSTIKSYSTVGVNANLYFYDNELNETDADLRFKLNQFLITPFFNTTRHISGRWDLELGSAFPMTNTKLKWDPRFKASRLIKQNHLLTLSAGMYSQLLNSNNYFFNNTYQTELSLQQKSKFIRSLRGSVNHTFDVGQIRFWTEAYYYYFQRVFTVDGSSQAKTYGVTANSERSFYRGFYYKMGANVFRSLTGSVSNQYDLKFNFNLSLGKEWTWVRKGNDRSLAVNAKSYLQGGSYFSELQYQDETGSSQQIDSYRLDDYFRTDLRIVWTLSKSQKRTSSLALDIQNVTNYKNESFRYFDDFTNEVESQYNLGLIPILTYRVEW